MNLFVTAVVIVLIIVGLVFFIEDKHLKTGAAVPSELQGTFTLMMYGCHSPGDIENMVIFDKENDAYSFEIFAPDFAYKVKTRVSAQDALTEAEKFVRCNIHCQGSELKKILGPGGNTIGFEMTPLYSLVKFGMQNVLDVSYAIKERKVVATIKLDPTVEKVLTSQ